MSPEVIEGVFLIAAGGVGVQVAKSITQGIRDALRARGKSQNRSDALLASRQFWIEECFELRLIIKRNGIEVEELNVDEDPYSIWQQRHSPPTTDTD